MEKHHCGSLVGACFFRTKGESTNSTVDPLGECGSRASSTRRERKMEITLWFVSKVRRVLSTGSCTDLAAASVCLDNFFAVKT